MKNKNTLKLIIAIILYTVIIAGITCAITVKVINPSTVVTDDVTVSSNTIDVQKVVEEPETSIENLKITEVDNDATTADLTLSDGSTYTFNIPEGHKYITENYVENIMQAYDTASDISCDSIIVTGNGDSIFDSVESVSATTISGLKQLMYSLYGNNINVDDLAYSEAYIYMKTGEVPETNLIDYSIEEVSKISVDDVTYTAYNVGYYIDVEGTGNKVSYKKTSAADGKIVTAIAGVNNKINKI